MRRNELPATCFSVLASTGQLIIIKKGEHGYYPSDWDTGDKAKNRDIASEHNQQRGISDIQETAMLAGSMFDWSVPGADPQWYMDNARYVNSNTAKGHIKDPVMSIYYPFDDFLLQYDMMRKRKFYLPLSALPKELMGADAQFVMLPDLVCGVPVMPVTVMYAEKGTCTVSLENGSFTAEKESNANHVITARVRVGNAEFVMGEHPTAPSQFVTWKRNCKNDGDGPHNYFWGHYSTTREGVIEDFCQRVKDEYTFLKEHAIPHRDNSIER